MVPTLSIPPINAEFAMPAPPATVKAPVVVEVVAVVAVTASPDKLTSPVLGFITNEATVDRPIPVPDGVLTTVIENCELLVAGITATDDAAAGGTACHVGTEFAPVEVNTYPEFELAANLARDVPVDATNRSPTL